MRGFLTAAASSGSGKTMMTCGLLELLKKKGYVPAAFKCGPDFIDPLFHRQVQGVETTNLDCFFSAPDQLRRLFWSLCREQGKKAGKGLDQVVAVTEGVMGLYDGIGASSWKGSSWDLAGILDLPIVFVADARGAGLSVLAQIQGFLDYRPSGRKQGRSRIRCVVLNGISPVLYPQMKELIQDQLGVPVAGYVPKLPWLKVESRHLGLVLPEELPGLRNQLGQLGQVMEETIDLELLLSLSGLGEEVREEEQAPVSDKPAFTLAVAMDPAFCFYYRENLNMLEREGARLEYFSPLKDGDLPRSAQGILLGGGYPELYARELGENLPMRQAIAQAAKKGMPMLAECGGYLYLLEELEGMDGRMYPMAGVFSGQGMREKKLRHFGYITLERKQEGPYLKAGQQIRGHEFHYWHCSQDDSQGVMQARKPSGRASWPAMRQKQEVLAGFPHLYYPSSPEFVSAFGRACRAYGDRRKEP